MSKLGGRSFFFQPFHKKQISDSSKLKEFADDNFKWNENGVKFSKRVENTVGKGGSTSNFSFSHSVFKRLVLQPHKNQGLFGKGLIIWDQKSIETLTLSLLHK